MLQSERDFIFKVILVGDSGVGKTSLRRRFMGESFTRNYIATIGCDFSYCSISLAENSIRFSIWDLAGQPGFERIHPQYFKNALACIIVYDVTKPITIDHTHLWLLRVLEFNASFDSVVAIVGNKVDLLTEEERRAKEVELNRLVQLLHEKYNYRFRIVPAMTSALTGEGVEGMFHNVGMELVEWVDAQIEEQAEESGPIEAIHLVSHSLSSGSRIVSSYPFSDSEVLVDGTMRNVSKLTALFDFRRTSMHNNFFAKTPWPSSDGTAYSLTRVVDRKKDNDDNYFYLLMLLTRPGSGITHEVEHFIEEQLSQTFNSVEEIIVKYRADFSATEFNPFIRFKSARHEIARILSNLNDELSYRLG